MGTGRLTPDDLAVLIESNVATFLLQMGAAGGGDERSDHEVTWTVGGSPIGYHNAVVRCQIVDPGRAEAVVGDFQHELRTRRLPGSWHLTPTMVPGHLRAVLTTAGFEDGGEEPALAAELPPDVDEPTTDLAISPVRSGDDVQGYRDVLAVGFGEGPTEADWVATVFSELGDGAGWSHFVGRVDHAAVATASLLLTPPVGGIYFVCTRPEDRRRGYGAAITLHAMWQAARGGASHAVLGSSPMGQRLYEKLGFRTVFSYRLMEWEP